VTAQELRTSLDKLAALDERLGGEGPRPLTRVLNEVARASVPRAKKKWTPRRREP
jgi:hypothetical protein